jgi:hypothetical protein
MTKVEKAKAKAHEARIALNGERLDKMFNDIIKIKK